MGLTGGIYFGAEANLLVWESIYFFTPFGAYMSPTSPANFMKFYLLLKKLWLFLLLKMGACANIMCSAIIHVRCQSENDGLKGPNLVLEW